MATIPTPQAPPLMYGVWIRNKGWLRGKGEKLWFTLDREVAETAVKLLHRPCDILPFDEKFQDMEEQFLKAEFEESRKPRPPWYRRVLNALS